jgi:hypothetical protein
VEVSPRRRGEHLLVSRGNYRQNLHPIPFQETYDKADDDKNRLDGMKLCKKT